MPSHLFLTRDVDLEVDPIKGSRFWAFARAIAGEADAKAFVDELRLRHKGASHHCFAWTLGVDAPQTRCSDDGEPGGTAGRPILREVEAAGVHDVCVVVARWFGGTKLGTGGLARAYGGAARALLERAPTHAVRVTQPARLRFAYPDTALVEAVLRDHALTPQAADYAADVTLTLAVPPEQLDAVERALSEASGGRIRLERL